MQRKFLLSSCLFFCVTSFSQEYPFVHYTPKDGLVNSRVRKAYQDSKGRMYFLTYGGLSVFDGARFNNYTTQQGLANDLVNDILEVGDDSLLVATNSGLFLNALVKGKIKKLNIERDTLPIINQFYRNEQGRIFLSSDNGLFILENKKITELNVSLLSGARQMLPYLGDISAMGNYIVISTNELKGHIGLYLYDINNNRICDALPEVQAYILGKDKNNNLWISMPDKLFILDNVALVKGKLSPITPVHGYAQAKDYSTINIAFDDGSIWFVHRNEDYRNEDIHRIEENGSLIKIPLPEQATSSDIKNIIIDRENTIWLCNDGEGVFKMVNSALRIFQNPLGASMQSQTNNVYYSTDAIWFNTNNYKLFRKSKKGMQQFNSNVKQAPVIFYEAGKKILGADYCNIYEALLTDQSTLYFNKIITLNDPDFFATTQILDNKGTILSGQKTSICIWQNRRVVFRIPISNYDGVQRMIIDKNNLLWVAKRHTGIDVYSIHPENTQGYLQLVYHYNREQFIGSIRSFVIDKTGLIWVGTREDGLGVYKQTANSLTLVHHFNVANGLTDNFVTSLACDSLNNILVGTQTGLDRIFHKDTSWQIENLSKSNDFFSYIKRVWVDAENQGYALTNTGVILQVSPPSPENEKKYTPKLLLEEIKVNGQSIPIGRQNFRYRENNINFLVAAPSFIDEKRIAYSYLLEGSGNRKWSDTSSVNSAINLTNLSKGEYLLKVKAFFPSTSYAPAELSYSFVITPPWWQTVLFRVTLASLIMGILIIGFRFYYRRKLERQMTMLEKQQAVEKERARIATDMHDDLGAGLTKIKFITEGIAEKNTDPGIAYEAERLKSSSNELVEKMSEIIWAMSDKNNTLEDLIFYIRSYTVEYCHENNLDCEFIIPETIPDKTVGGQIRRNIFLVLKECLHNVVKHAKATKVIVTIGLQDKLSLSVSDNGKGAVQSMDNRGNGLLNMRRRAADMHGSLEISNAAGTTIRLNVPV